MDVPRQSVLLLLPGTSLLAGTGGADQAVGADAVEALTVLKRLTTAGYTVRTVSPTATPTSPEPVGPTPSPEDLAFLRGVLGDITVNGVPIRVTLRDLTSLDLAAARRVHARLIVDGASPGDAYATVVAAATTAWRDKAGFTDGLMGEGVAAELIESAITETARAQEGEKRWWTEEFAGNEALSTPTALSDFTESDFAAAVGVVVPGGRAALAGLADNPQVGRLIENLHARGALIATIGQGAAALLSAGGDSEGRWLFDGYRLVASAAEEDAQTYGADQLPWVLAHALMNAGAVFDDVEPWGSHVTVDRNVITAQNRFSTEAFTDAVQAFLALGLHTEGVPA